MMKNRKNETNKPERERNRPDPLIGSACIAASLTALYFAIYICTAGFSMPSLTLFSLAVIAACVLPVVFRKKLEIKLGRAFRPLTVTLTVLVGIFLASLVAFWVYIGLDASKDADDYAVEVSSTPDDRETVIVVFGCRTYGYNPSKSLRLRLEEAKKLLGAMPDALCVVSGGQGDNETVPEAEAMRAWLEENGISPDRLIVEPDSHTTSENIRYTKELLDKLGLSDARIIGVSTAFHLPRIETLSRLYGLPMELCAAPSANFAQHYSSMVREYFSYVKMLFADIIFGRT